MEWPSNFFRELAENNRMVLWAINAEGTYTYISENVQEVLGYRADELIGKRTFFDLLATEGREAFLAKALIVAAEHASFRNLENCVRTKSGGRVWFSTSGLPVVGRDGTFLGYRGWDIDVSEIHEDKAQLQTLTERLQLAKRAGGMGIWDWDLRTNELIWDQEMWAIFGRDANHSLSPMEVWTKALHVHDQDRVNREILQAFEAGTDFKSGFRIVRPDGSIRYLRADGIVERGDAGELLRMVGTNWDVTDAKLVELQFLRAQRAEGVGTLASGIAHNLNNALSPILVATELLKNEIKTDDGAKLLETIERCTKHSANLISEMLSFARGVEGMRREVDLGTLLSDLVELLRRTFPDTIRVDYECAHDLLKVSADPSQLQQVFMNICLNARDAMESSGVLTICARNHRSLGAVNAGSTSELETNRVIVEISDTGCGMDAATIERIFDPFFSTKLSAGGTGLGLASSSGIIKSHGGYIDVSSEPGRGARFEVHLPGAAGLSDASFNRPDGEELKYDSIYILGSNHDLAAKLRRAIISTGLRTSVHRNASAILAAMQRGRHGARLIVVDETVQLSELNEFLVCLPTVQKETPPLILVTSLGHELPRQEVLDRMQVFYLLSPMEDSALKRLLFDALAAKRMNRPMKRPPSMDKSSPVATS